MQRTAIPAILRGQDVWAEAPTGSGKTGAVALPLLQKLAGSEPRRSGRFASLLVLSPTRELALQTAAVFNDLASSSSVSLKCVTLVGGVSINPQLKVLGGGADIIIATPGRLLDVVDKNAVSLEAVHTLLLDEADRLFAPGFADELEACLALLPKRSGDGGGGGGGGRCLQTLLLSATFPYRTRPVAERLLHDPLRIVIESTARLEEEEEGGELAREEEIGSVSGGGRSDGTTSDDTPDITQRCLMVDEPRRTQLLVQQIQANGWERCRATPLRVHRSTFCKPRASRTCTLRYVHMHSALCDCVPV